MKIRTAKNTDLPDLVSLWWEMQNFHFKYDFLFYGTKPEQISKDFVSIYFKRALEDKNHILIIMERDKKSIGMLHCDISDRPPIHEEEKQATILEASVTERFRGQGIFQKMFNYLKNELQLRNIRVCTLLVDKDNLGGIRAYEKCDFKERQKFMICKL